MTEALLRGGRLQLATAEAIDQRVITGYYTNPPTTPVVSLETLLV